MAGGTRLEAAYKQLREAAKRLERLGSRGYGDEQSRLDVTRAEDGLRVHWLLNEDALFKEDKGEEIFTTLYHLLGSPRVAPWLTSLTLEGHQIAANGTIGWDIEPIASAQSRFARLKTFRLESVAITDWHPASAGRLESRERNEASLATRLLDRMPVLADLAIPEPPGEETFFRGAPHPLRKLSVYDTDYESFVARLTGSRRFPHLEELHVIESVRTDVNPRLPVNQYARLFQSDAFPVLRAVTLGQVDVVPKQIPLLRGTRIGRQLCRLRVMPAEQWDDSPIMRAPRESVRSLRDLCGDPFPTVAVDRTWRTDAVMTLVRAMSATGDLSAMPILADALQEAGCDNAELLDHCRSEGPHVAGCWVIELLDGR